MRSKTGGCRFDSCRACFPICCPAARCRAARAARVIRISRPHPGLHPGRRTLAPQRLRHAIEVAADIRVVGVEACVPHRHRDRRRRCRCRCRRLLALPSAACSSAGRRRRRSLRPRDVSRGLHCEFARSGLRAPRLPKEVEAGDRDSTTRHRGHTKPVPARRDHYRTLEQQEEDGHA